MIASLAAEEPWVSAISTRTWGVGEDTDTAKANFDAVLSAVTRIPGALDRLSGRVSSGAGQKGARR